MGKIKNIGMELHRYDPTEWNSFMEICLAGAIGEWKPQSINENQFNFFKVSIRVDSTRDMKSLIKKYVTFPFWCYVLILIC